MAWLQALSGAAALVVWGGFVLLCLGLSYSNGLCCADDAFFAVCAKNLATGAGYLKPLEGTTEPHYFMRFNPPFGLGPTLVVPCAAIMWVVGVNEAVPGWSAVLVWSCVLTALFVRLGRHGPWPRLFPAVLVFCIAAVVMFAPHFEAWFAFLAEIPVAAFSLLALSIVSLEELSPRSLFLAGLFLGLAVLTKPIAALVVPSVLGVLALRAWGAGLDREAMLRNTALVSVSCVLPIAVFEAVKLQQLGILDYARYTWSFLHRLYGQGAVWGVGRILARPEVHAEQVPILAVLQRRIEAIHANFAIHPVLLVAFLALPFVLRRRWLEEKWQPLFLGLCLSTWSLGAHWLFLSVGWPRYLVVAVAIGCFALCVPIVGLRRARHRIVFALLVLALLAVGGGIDRIRLVGRFVDLGLFRQSGERMARTRVVATLKEQMKRDPAILASEWWASFVDVEFNLDGPMNFRRFDRVSALPGRKLVLINHRFPGMDPDVTRDVRSRASGTLFSEGPYELLEIK